MVATLPPAALAGLDDEPAAAAAQALRPVCASGRWVAEMVAGRPYGDLPTLLAASDAALAGLEWADVEQALSAHPRIGAGAAGEHREAAWSRQEQSAAAAGGADVRADLVAANLAYEDRFGWVFLICASGRSAAEILTAARSRLDHDVATEQTVVRAELRDIVRLRLAKAFAPEAAADAEPAGTGTAPAGTPAGTSVSTHVLDAVTGRPAAGMAVGLDRRDGADWVPLARRVTDADGRVPDLAAAVGPGVCRLVFDTGGWSPASPATAAPAAASAGRHSAGGHSAGGGPAAADPFYPEVVITFRVTADDEHLHVPLLLSPFAYSTYRGS